MKYENVASRRQKVSPRDREIMKRLQRSSTPLRERYLEDLRFHHFSRNTINRYVEALLQLTAHFWKSPEQLTDEELRVYFSYLEDGCKYSGSTLKIVHAALRFFYDYSCPKEMPFLKIFRAEKKKSLPVVLSREEVRKILFQVKDLRYHACLSLIYSCGLRVSEAVKIKVGDIDSSLGLLYVRRGKGGKPRAVPLPKRTLEILREMWKSHRHPELLFPAYNINLRQTPSHYGCKDKPFSNSAVGNHFHAALSSSGCRKAATMHSLRHSFATHLLEEGIPFFTVKEYLGHSGMQSTLVYSHFTSKIRRGGQGSIEELMSDLP